VVVTCASPMRSSTPAPEAPARRLLDLALGFVAAAYAFVATFRAPTYTPAGLDGAWRLEIGRLYLARIFGSEAAFTYGPLAWLLEPSDVTGAVFGAAMLRFAQQAALAAVVGLLAFRGRRIAAFVLLAAWVVATWSGLMFEHGLVLLLPLLAIPPRREGGRWGVGLVLAAALAGAAVFVKTSLAVSALGVCVTAGALDLYRRRRGAWPSVAAAAGTYATTVVVLGAVSLRSLRELPDWLHLSLQMADGYSVAMSLDGVARNVWMAVALLAAMVALAAWLLQRGATAGDVALAFAVPVFMTFKHAFVRHDAHHEVAFLPFVVAALGVLLIRAEKMAEILATVAVLGVAIIGAAVLARAPGTPAHPRLREIVSGSRGLTNIRHWADVSGETRRQHDAIEEAIQVDRVPSLHDRVAGRTVGIVPWELSYCRAADLRCVANPTLQVFAAYTAALDERTAAHYAGPAAPDLVLIEDRAIDGRSVILDTPATMRALLAYYDEAPPQPAEGLRLLVRRPVPYVLAPTTMGRAEIVSDRWIAAPATAGLLFAKVAMDLSIRGRVEKALYKVPAVRLDVLYQDSRVASYRIVPDTARNGLLVTGLGDAEEGLSQIFARTAGSAVASIRFSGPGLRAFRTPMALTWEAAAPPAVGMARASGREKPAPASLERRRPPDGKPLLAIDVFAPELEDGRGGMLRLKGWAVDPATGHAAKGVLVEVAGTVGWIPVGRRRPDVAAVFGVPGYANAGYGGVIDLAGVPPGRHEIAFKVVSEDGRSYYDAPKRRQIEVR
jgi:hypothetical protein